MPNSTTSGVKIRHAVMTDVLTIQSLINQYAKDEVMLPKTLNQLYENLRDYLVLEKDNRIIACGALHFYWEDLAEIRSLAVESEHTGKGYASLIVEYLVQQAKEYKIKKVFCLTLVDKFFEKLGFNRVSHSELPQKVYKDCINCMKLGNCDEIAMVRYTE